MVTSGVAVLRVLLLSRSFHRARSLSRSPFSHLDHVRRLVALERIGNLAGCSVGYGADRVEVQMSIALGCRCSGVAQNLAQDEQGIAARHGDTRVRVPQIVDANA